ncbi:MULTISPECIES: SWF or SNF family helicase [Streptomyces]|uniref:SWF or SNF family helicase n=1 Tax=Streptomyces dengpaensis TaxID=2049881 RepID=A0ABN5IAL4_9ACTN|nr:MULTISPECIES: SWF or SNF family helicase [Streptomyces]AVH60242.1 SWF or SNF family helicase [Streptomyces dengpaensis]PIB06742.1 SWF or SNF family helicase [Streptomyces sp. HG99]
MTDRNMERTFAALPPARGRGFAQTWWGRAWLKALEDAALDSEQVKTGRRLARAGAVGAVSVRPGRITAVVQDRDRTTHRADVLLQELSEDQWDRFLDMAVERAGHIAALLDRDMPPHLVEDAAAAGVELLPGLGDLEAQCDCGAWDHCGHTAALCYQMARLLDQDPLVLLLMRGRGERALLDELQERGSTSAEEPPDASGAGQEGVDAAEAYAAGDILPPLPALPELPQEPGQPPSLDTEATPAPGLDPAAVEFLAAAAAGEAYRLLAEALGSGHGQQAVEAELTLAQDSVRLAASSPEQAITQRLAEGSGRDGEELRLAVRAWRYGGVDALSVLEDEWPVQAESLARARAALESAWEEDERPLLRAAHNRWTAVGASTQLRLGRDGRWWPYRKEGGRWAPAGPAVRDPATALATAAGEPMNG